MSKFKKTVFTGAATAIVTPFKDGKVDYDTFGSLIDFQLNGGIDALVVAGTTPYTALTPSAALCDSLLWLLFFFIGLCEDYTIFGRFCQ